MSLEAKYCCKTYAYQISTRTDKGDQYASVNNTFSNICEPACDLNPKEYLIVYNDIKIVNNDILNDFIDDSTADTESISTINSEEYE